MIELKHIEKSYNGKKVIEDLSATITPEAYICVEGASGDGKTTLLNIIAGFTKPDKGEILADFGDISYMPCGNCLLEALTVKENLELVWFNEELINKLKLMDILNLYPREISSGEYKRVALARTILMNRTYILLDEPTSNLDETSAELIIDVINNLKKNHGIVIATHDKKLKDGDVMKTFFETLKAHIEQYLPSYGDGDSVLSMLYEAFAEATPHG